VKRDTRAKGEGRYDTGFDSRHLRDLPAAPLIGDAARPARTLRARSDSTSHHEYARHAGTVVPIGSLTSSLLRRSVRDHSDDRRAHVRSSYELLEIDRQLEVKVAWPARR
jgi:hypothetical protein